MHWVHVYVSLLEKVTFSYAVKPIMHSREISRAVFSRKNYVIRNWVSETANWALKLWNKNRNLFLMGKQEKGVWKEVLDNENRGMEISKREWNWPALRLNWSLEQTFKHLGKTQIVLLWAMVYKTVIILKYIFTDLES